MGHTSPILSVLFVVLVEHWNFKSNNVVKSGNQVLPTPKVFGVSFCCFCYYCIFVLFVRGFLKQPGISPRCKHNVFLGLFWDFPWESAVTFKFSLYMQLFLNTQPLMSGLWKGKGEKWRGEKKTHPYTLLGSQISGGGDTEGFAMGEVSTIMATHVFVPLWSEASISSESTDHQYLSDSILFS